MSWLCEGSPSRKGECLVPGGRLHVLAILLGQTIASSSLVPNFFPLQFLDLFGDLPKFFRTESSSGA